MKMKLNMNAKSYLEYKSGIKTLFAICIETWILFAFSLKVTFQRSPAIRGNRLSQSKQSLGDLIIFEIL